MKTEVDDKIANLCDKPVPDSSHSLLQLRKFRSPRRQKWTRFMGLYSLKKMKEYIKECMGPGAHYQERECKVHPASSTIPKVSIFGSRFPAKRSYHDDCRMTEKYGRQTIGTVMAVEDSLNHSYLIQNE